MRKYFLLSLFVMSVFTGIHAQYKIYGHVPDLPDGTMYLELSHEKKDSAKVENNCFTLESSTPLEAPSYVYMYHSNNNWRCFFWMGNDNIDFTTVNDMPVIKGSKTQDEYDEYRRTLEPVWEYGLLLKEQMKDVAKADSIMKIVETVYNAKNDSAFVSFLKKNPSSYIALNHIYNMRVMDKTPFKKYMEYANMLTPGAFKGKQWKTFCELREKDEVLEPGHPMPPFSMNDLYGKTIDIASMKGKYVLLTLSNYGVQDYDSDLRLRKRLYDKYAGKGLEMVDYSLSKDIVGVMKAPANMGLRWHFVTDFKSFDCPWLKEHAIDHITQNFLIDRNGMIIGRNLFGEELETEINNIFN
ncbi:MAG: DUF4369 domain-containing protein [Prevotella sp.]